MKRVLARSLLYTGLIVLLAAAWVGYGVYSELQKTASEDPTVWENAIQAFDDSHARGETPENAVIFIGSSSIRLWRSLEDDMAPVPVIRRGFGGAKINDVVHYTERLVAARSPRALVVFVGANDIQPGATKPAAALLESFRAFVTRARDVHPDIPIYYIGITPTPLRWEVWPSARQANRAIADYISTQENLHFIDTSAALLGPDGLPVRDNYIFDRLHLSGKGYAAWTAIIRPWLLADFPDYQS